MPFTDRTITVDELRETSLRLVTNYHDDGMDEPYDGAGYCTCWLCQEIAPRFFAAADSMAALQAENTALRAPLVIETAREFLSRVDIRPGLGELPGDES